MARNNIRRDNKSNINNNINNPFEFILIINLGVSNIFCLNGVIFYSPFPYTKLVIFWGSFAIGIEMNLL